jgi:hypothetical protein
MIYFLIFAIIVFLLFRFYISSTTENFTCYPDLYDEKYHNSVKSVELKKADIDKLLARKPKYHNETIIPMKKDILGTIYYSAYSESGDLLGYIKMVVTEKFMGNLIDTGFYEQELFGFSGYSGYICYQVCAMDDEILYKLMKRAIHQLKQDGSRYYLSILCLSEELAKKLMDKFRFVLSLKEQSKRFYKDTLYTLVYYK